MDFRGMPFQFSATNPADRQSELMRRFGVPPVEKMFTETVPAPFADALSQLSPRLQHRIPGFLPNEDQPRDVNCQSHAENVDSSKAEPKVRIVPIQIEGESEKPRKQRTHSGGVSVPNKYPGGSVDEQINSGSYVPLFDSRKINYPFFTNRPFFQRNPRECASEVDAPQSEAKVCNIPINLEDKDKPSTKGTKLSHSRTVPLQKETSKRGATNMGNGPCVSKSATEPSSTDTKDDKRQKPDINIFLKQIEMILKEFKSHEESVHEFSGMQNDKRYRYLDEMLTRCMLKLDDIETFGNEDVRKARKAAVKRVQDAINVLDSKVQHKPKKNNQTSVEVDKPVTEEKPSPVETAVEDVVMIEDTAQNQYSKDAVPVQNIPCSENENVSESRPNLNEMSDSTMEVEAPENKAPKNAGEKATIYVVSENVVSSEGTIMGTEPNEYAEKINVEITENGNKEVYPLKAGLTTTSENLKDDIHLQFINVTEENSKHCANLTNGGLSNLEEISSNPKAEGCTDIKDLKDDCTHIQKVSVISGPGVIIDVDMKDLEHDVSVKS